MNFPLFYELTCSQHYEEYFTTYDTSLYVFPLKQNWHVEASHTVSCVWVDFMFFGY